MDIINIFLLVVFVAASLILILLVLIQDEKGEGLGGLFGGSSTTPFGSRSGNILTRFTTIVGAIFLFTSFMLAWLSKSPESGDVVGAARRQGTTAESTLNWWEKEAADENSAVESEPDIDSLTE
jgi:preprotein translocase subunit SecG